MSNALSPLLELEESMWQHWIETRDTCTLRALRDLALERNDEHRAVFYAILDHPEGPNPYQGFDAHGKDVYKWWDIDIPPLHRRLSMTKNPLSDQWPRNNIGHPLFKCLCEVRGKEEIENADMTYPAYGPAYAELRQAFDRLPVESMTWIYQIFYWEDGRPRQIEASETPLQKDTTAP